MAYIVEVLMIDMGKSVERNENTMASPLGTTLTVRIKCTKNT